MRELLAAFLYSALMRSEWPKRKPHYEAACDLIKVVRGVI